MTFNPKFMTNGIRPTASGPTLADIISDYKNKANKVASSEKVVKTASTETAEVKEAEVKTALTPAQEKLPEALKNAIKAKEEKSGKGDKKDDKKEVKDEKKDGKKDEKKDKKEDDKKCAETTEVVVKIAEEDEAPSSGQLKVEPLHQKGESTPTPHKEKEKTTGASAKKSTEKDEAESSGQPEAEGKLNNDPKAGEHRDGDGDQKKADTNPRFVKVANLDAKTKSWLRNYWKNLYPAKYVDAMLADK